jgi:hypothetical protein
VHSAGPDRTIRTFPVRSDNGEDEAGSASVVERRCEEPKDSGESETLGASGGEEAASYSERGCAKGDGARRAVPVDQSKAAVTVLVRQDRVHAA